MELQEQMGRRDMLSLKQPCCAYRTSVIHLYGERGRNKLLDMRGGGGVGRGDDGGGDVGASPGEGGPSPMSPSVPRVPAVLW